MAETEEIREAEVTAEAEPEIPRDPTSGEVLTDFFHLYAGGGFKFAILRKEPKTVLVEGVLHRCSGHLETIDEPPTPDYLSEFWGGGVYEIKVLGPGEWRQLPAASLDVVIMNSVAQYISRVELETLLDDFLRLLKPDGEMILTI